MTREAAAHDRHGAYTPAPRPAWIQKLNEVGRGLDLASLVPLHAASLLRQAEANTGLSDFGSDDWREPFSILTASIDAEAELNLAGRLLTRTEYLIYLEARLRIVEEYRRHPQIHTEVIDRPVLITGYGRSGTTILFEVLAKDPQFRVALKWESLFPVPVPQAATYRTDPRIARAENVNRLIEEILPEIAGMHKIAGNLPVESLELDYGCFRSEVFPMQVNVPRYAAYLRGCDLTVSFEWQKTFLKLLQSGFRARHWLMKSPTHLLHLEKYLRVFSGMRVIFTHRDPIVTADSTASFLDTLLWLRTDSIRRRDPRDLEVLASAERRAAAWDPIIAMIGDGRIARGAYANFYYADFIREPLAAVQSIYEQLEMTLLPDVAERMRAYLAARTQGKHGVHHYEQAPANTVASERPSYRRYQSFFRIPDEI
jgi:hypothetical protein